MQLLCQTREKSIFGLFFILKKRLKGLRRFLLTNSNNLYNGNKIVVLFH